MAIERVTDSREVRPGYGRRLQRDKRRCTKAPLHTPIWTAYRTAFRQNLPRVAVAGPDTSNNLEWMTRFAADHAGDVTLLTSHYYVGGPPTDPAMTAEFLLRPGERFAHDCRKFVAVAQAACRP